MTYGSAQQTTTSSTDQTPENAGSSHVRTHKPRRLQYVLQAVNAWGTRPFRYGETDCCQFAAYVLEYLTGENPMAELSYHSRVEADQLIRSLGGLTGALTTTLDREPVPKVHLLPGDPVLLRRPGVEAVCVYLGTENVIGLDLQGVPRRFPLRWCPYGWAV